MALKTAWTVSIPDDRGSTRDGGDPLGFRSYANRLARELVPMLTQSTFQTRGFSLLCLGVEVAAKTQSEADAQRAFQHTERLWAAASVFHQGDDAPVAGKRPRNTCWLKRKLLASTPLSGRCSARHFRPEHLAATADQRLPLDSSKVQLAGVPVSARFD